MPAVRWLLSIVLALAVVASSTMAWASAGIVGGDDCCCPVKSKCKCHDHDGDGPTTPVMKKCGGKSELVSPTVAVATLAEAIETGAAPRARAVVTDDLDPIPDDWSLVPERPPF